MTDAELKQHLEAAEKSPRQIAAAVSGLPDKVLRYKPSPDKWSILEILAHLADMEILYAYRSRQILADKAPAIAPIEPDDWGRHLGYIDTPASESVALSGLMRHHNLRLLRRLNAADLQKGAFHPELKRQLTLEEIMGMMVRHGPNHLEQIEKLKKAAAQ